MIITSLQNPKIKEVVKLRKRMSRTDSEALVVEGYRELRRALDNHWAPLSLFYCPDYFLGKNEGTIIELCQKSGATLYECSAEVFEKIAYRDRPEGLLAVGPQIKLALENLVLPEAPLLLVAAGIEKPGNLGTMLRTADAAGVNGVIVCDRCTDINNPNVVRASIGTLFCVPVVETTSEAAIAWLKAKGIQIIAATPAATMSYAKIDMKLPTAIVVGSEQYGLENIWFEKADQKVIIPMFGQCDSLNVSAAATILLYEAVRQRLA